MTTQNENSPLTRNASGQENGTAIEARGLSREDNDTASENFSPYECPAPEQASEAANSGAGPVREAIVDANAAGSNGTSSKVRTVWSSNNEDFTCDELDELLDMHDDLTIGAIVFVGEVAPIPTKHLCDADDVIDLMGERAYDEVGEYADGYPDVTSEAKAELDALLAGWIERHAKPTFFSVVNVRQHVITEADMEGRG